MMPPPDPPDETRGPIGPSDAETHGLAVVTLGQLRARYTGSIEWLVEGYIAQRELTMVVGAAESLKSWAMADLARAVLTGGEWLAHFPVAQGRVLYLEQE